MSDAESDPDDDAAFERVYGPWEAIRPDQVGEVLAGFDRPWWVAGGWAIEAFTGVARAHGDVDVCILARDLPALRSALGGRLHLWSVGSGMLRPLDDDFPELHPESAQVWVREHALAPWLLDIQVNPDDRGRWVDRRLPDHVAPLDQVTWTAADGVRYLEPEIALLFKARLHRPKDDRDLEAALPLLGEERRSWLRDALEVSDPGHPWRARLGSVTGGGSEETRRSRPTP